jgi:S1-C subfamily serine protease
LPLVLAGAALALAAYLIWERVAPVVSPDPVVARPVIARGDLSDFEKTNIAIYERARPSVVHIENPSRPVMQLFGGVQEVPGGSGTGFIWDESGHIVTNYHVVREYLEMLDRGMHQPLQVRLHDQTAYKAEIVGRPRPDLDIAVVKLIDPPAHLRPIAIGSSSNLKVGQLALAIGNPFGLDQTLTVGVISALDRSMESLAGTPIRSVIQVDAAINPGNSGGPLLDSAGLLIGMNTAIKSPSGVNVGIGFAVPVDTIHRVVPEIIGGPEHGRAMLGVQTTLVRLGDGRHLVMIASIPKESGARAAGLRSDEDAGRIDPRMRGDIILRIDGQEVGSYDDIHRILSTHGPGDIVDVTVLRGLPFKGEEVTLEVQLGRAEDFR